MVTTRSISGMLCSLAVSATGCTQPVEPTPSVPAAEHLPPAPLHSPTGPDADALRLLPGAAEVEVLVTTAHPVRRIIHVRDWHFVPRDLYALDLWQTGGRHQRAGSQ